MCLTQVKFPHEKYYCDVIVWSNANIINIEQIKLNKL